MRRLRELRQQAKLTQAELGKIVNTSASAIGMYEQGRREPPVNVLVKMANFFHVTVDYLAEKPMLLNFNPQDKDKELQRELAPSQKDIDDGAKLFLKTICKNNPKAAALIDTLTVTANGEIKLSDTDDISQAIINVQLKNFIAALKNAKPNPDGTFHVDMEVNLPKE